MNMSAESCHTSSRACLGFMSVTFNVDKAMGALHSWSDTSTNTQEMWLHEAAVVCNYITNQSIKTGSYLKMCSVISSCAAYLLGSTVCLLFSLSLSELDAAQHTHGAPDDITALHLRVAVFSKINLGIPCVLPKPRQNFAAVFV